MSWTKLSEFENNNSSIAGDWTYVEAVRFSLHQSMAMDDRIIVMGQGVNDKNGMFGMTDMLYKEYGKERVFDTPISENSMMGIAIGAAMAGMHPVYFHNRPDFLYLAFDQLINHASKCHYMSGGQYSVPLIVWAVTGQGWGSAAQHSQSIQGLLNNIPGLKIVMPTTPNEAKNMLFCALKDSNPVVFLDHRFIHGEREKKDYVSNDMTIGKGIIRKSGKDVSIVAISTMQIEALKAAKELERFGISAEIIDPITISPMDYSLIEKSVRKTHRLIIADNSWERGGVANDLAAHIYNTCFEELSHSIEVIASANTPTPASYVLEDTFYRGHKDIFETATMMCRRG